MNKHNLAKGLFSALLLASSVVSADEQYPAADFQPSVVYQDENYIKSTQNAAKQAAPVATTSSSASSAAPVAVDSQYPAADFQPKVIYSDDNYKHDKSVPAKSTKNVASASSADEVASVENTVSEEKKKEDSSLTYLLGLVGLAAAGFFLFREQNPASAAPKKASVAVAPVSGKVAATTGVGKYINKVSGTGVSRYVDQQVKVAKSATSVSKYVAQKTLADKAKAAEDAEKNATGVEKYMRKRG